MDPEGTEISQIFENKINNSRDWFKFTFYYLEKDGWLKEKNNFSSKGQSKIIFYSLFKQYQETRNNTPRICGFIFSNKGNINMRTKLRTIKHRKRGRMYPREIAWVCGAITHQKNKLTKNVIAKWNICN